MTTPPLLFGIIIATCDYTYTATTVTTTNCVSNIGSDEGATDSYSISGNTLTVDRDTTGCQCNSQPVLPHRHTEREPQTRPYYLIDTPLFYSFLSDNSTEKNFIYLLRKTVKKAPLYNTVLVGTRALIDYN